MNTLLTCFAVLSVLQLCAVIHLLHRIGDLEAQFDDHVVTQHIAITRRADLHAQWINSLHLALFNRKGALKEKE